jgi:hypothetical protein
MVLGVIAERRHPPNIKLLLQLGRRFPFGNGTSIALPFGKTASVA